MIGGGNSFPADNCILLSFIFRIKWHPLRWFNQCYDAMASFEYQVSGFTLFHLQCLICLRRKLVHIFHIHIIKICPSIISITILTADKSWIIIIYLNVSPPSFIGETTTPQQWSSVSVSYILCAWALPSKCHSFRRLSTKVSLARSQKGWLVTRWPPYFSKKCSNRN